MKSISAYYQRGHGNQTSNNNDNTGFGSPDDPSWQRTYTAQGQVEKAEYVLKYMTDLLNWPTSSP